MANPPSFELFTLIVNYDVNREAAVCAGLIPDSFLDNVARIHDGVCFLLFFSLGCQLAARFSENLILILRCLP